MDGNDSRAIAILQDNLNGEARIELAQLYKRAAKEAEEETQKDEHYDRATLYVDQAMQIESSAALAAQRVGKCMPIVPIT